MRCGRSNPNGTRFPTDSVSSGGQTTSTATRNRNLELRLLADEYFPPAFVSALRGEGHDVVVVGYELEFGASDTTLLEYARDTARIIVSEDTDFRGVNPDLDIDSYPDVLAWDTAALLGEIAVAIRAN